MKNGFGAGLTLVAIGLAAPPAHAQTCDAGERIVGWIGITGLSCNCTVQTGIVPIWSFRSEPEVEGVVAGSPAAGALRAGDEIVALNGELITTSAAGRRFGALPPGHPLRFTVRRDARITEVTVTPEAICSGDPRARAAVPEAPPAPWAPRMVPRTPAPEPPGSPPAPPSARRPTPAPAAPPLPVGNPFRMRDAGWFGFGITCRRCDLEVRPGARSVWTFEEDPELALVEQGSPAWEAGLRAGDELLRIDGIALQTAEGGRRFGAVRPGDEVRWTYRRDGRESTVTVRAQERPMAPELERIAALVDTMVARSRRGERIPADFLRMWESSPAPPAVLPRTPAPAAFRTVRFHDFVGGAEVEVLGGPSVVTTIVEDGRDIIIDTGDARIRIRAVARTP